jgi:hypothetical protein
VHENQGNEEINTLFTEQLTRLHFVVHTFTQKKIYMQTMKEGEFAFLGE